MNIFSKLGTNGRVIFLAYLCSCQGPVFRSDIPLILGIDSNVVDVIDYYSIDEIGGFGEGYTIETYKLSEKTRNSFIETSSKKLPVKLSGQESHNSIDWKETPVDSAYGEVLNMCLDYRSENGEIEDLIAKTESMLGKVGVYYSFYFDPSIEAPQDVVLFVFDVGSNELFIIESNF